MITPLEFDELDLSLRESLRPRFERLGYLGDFFRYMGHQPSALAAFDKFTEECKLALGPEMAETVALTAATSLGNVYERNQHERLAVRRGMTRQGVAAVEALAPDDPQSPLSEMQRAVQRFVLAAIESLRSRDLPAADAGSDSAARLSQLQALSDDATAAAVALLTGRFVAHALISRACQLTATVPSIFEDGFDA